MSDRERRHIVRIAIRRAVDAEAQLRAAHVHIQQLTVQNAALSAQLQQAQQALAQQAHQALGQHAHALGQEGVAAHDFVDDDAPTDADELDPVEATRLANVGVVLQASHVTDSKTERKAGPLPWHAQLDSGIDVTEISSDSE